jgi:hypothetical protein
MFTVFDLILFGSGIAATLLLLLIMDLDQLLPTVIALAPAVITGFLVLPVPNYHNILTVIRSIKEFYTTRQRFVWKGWCMTDGKYDDPKTK